MIKTDRIIIVEGKYDKIRLSSVIDGVIIETDGFSVFNNKRKQAMIRALAEKKGILILTDSDAAGFRIRSYIGSIVPPETVTHAYIPDILGKEKRKSAPSKEGKIGVEGISQIVLITALRQAGIFCEEAEEPARKITKTDFYEDGISGKSQSRQLRQALIKKLNLPSRLSANSLLQIINAFMTYEEYKSIIEGIKNAQEK
ncbi:MAG: Ribonuclease M5 [Firmicutes bacterium ADurb.Bin300]|nr:MAG: Ribonuclease M5 [Firmicutes bacterium ADurb.Bin300]